jgi:hypothetical protein
MKEANITFGELRELLHELGFTEKAEKARLRFEHPRTVLLFPRYRPKQLVGKLDLFVVRRQLVYNGLIEESDLERFLQKASA